MEEWRSFLEDEATRTRRGDRGAAVVLSLIAALAAVTLAVLVVVTE